MAKLSIDTNDCTIFEIAEHLSYLADALEGFDRRELANKLQQVAETLDPSKDPEATKAYLGDKYMPPL